MFDIEIAAEQNEQVLIGKATEVLTKLCALLPIKVQV